MSGDQENQDGISADGKYLLISVPDFDPDPAQGPRQGEKMTSFLRLGAFHKNWESQPGANLAKNVGKVTNDYQGGHLMTGYGDPVDYGDLVGPFLDDDRNRDGADGTISKAERKDNSDKLFTRGGWWDHSDGNRISTTYGDKVEVIRGNYKLVVMGRQDDTDVAASLDASGGIIQDVGISMSGSSVRCEYREDKHGGVWHLENATLGFIQTNDFAGDTFEHWWGDKKYSTIGSEEGTANRAGNDYGNPHILEKTWAEKIEGYTGSSKRRIPEIHEETWAKTTFSKTDVSGNSTEETYCGATLKSVTGSASSPVPTIEEVTYAATTPSRSHLGASNEFVTVGAANSTTTVGAQLETTIAGVLGGITVAALNEELTVNAHHLDLELALMANSVFLGARVDLNLGFSREFNIGSHEDHKYPDAKKTKLKELDAALDRLWMTLNDTHVSTLQKNLALSLHLNGMQVAIGM